MAEILHQLIGSSSHCLQCFIPPRWCRISAINGINTSFLTSPHSFSILCSWHVSTLFPMENKRNTHWSTNIAGWNTPPFSIGNIHLQSGSIFQSTNKPELLPSKPNDSRSLAQLLSPATSLEPACLIQPLVTWGPWGEGCFICFIWRKWCILE